MQYFILTEARFEHDNEIDKLQLKCEEKKLTEKYNFYYSYYYYYNYYE